MLKKIFQTGILAIVLVFAIAVTGCVVYPDKIDEEEDKSNTEDNVKHTHTYSTTWSKNAAQHWRKCTGEGCNTKVRTANHTLDDGICTTCEYDTVHVHSYSTTWSKNAAQHWKGCTIAGCDAKREIADQAPPDNICSTCGYDTTHTHTYSTTWSKDEAQHWKECTVTGCDDKTEIANHAPPNGICTSCGYDNREDNNEGVGVAPTTKSFRSVTKYEIVPYNTENNSGKNNSGSTVTTASVPDGKTINPDQIKYSFSYENYDFYYVYLGVLANVPMFSFSTIMHDGILLSDYTVSISEEVRSSVSNSVETSVATAKSVVNENSVDQTTGGSVSQEVSMRWGNESAFFQAGIAITAEQNWETTRSSSRSEGLEQSTSLTRTQEFVEERARSTMEERPFFLSNEVPPGYYRYTMFASSDVYIYVVRDNVENKIRHFELKEFVRPDLLPWNLDYSEDGIFRKKDASNFKFDLDLLENLPPARTVTVKFHLNYDGYAESDKIPSEMLNSGRTLGSYFPTPKERVDYTFAGWNTESNGSGTTYTMSTPIEANTDLYAQWLYTPVPKFNIAFTAGSGGRVTVPSLSNIFDNTLVEIEAIADDHNAFVNWEITSGSQFITMVRSTEAKTTITTKSNGAHGNQNIAIKANFQAITYSITLTQNLAAGGTVPSPTFKNLTAGVEVEIRAVEAEHYRFSEWVVVSGTPAPVISNNRAPTTTVRISSNVTIQARFDRREYMLFTERYPTSFGNINQGSGLQPANLPVSITATPAAGRQFVRWIVTSGNAEFSNPEAATTTVTVKSDNTTIKAVFLHSQYTVMKGYNGGEIGKFRLYNTNTGATARMSVWYLKQDGSSWHLQELVVTGKKNGEGGDYNLSNLPGITDGCIVSMRVDVAAANTDFDIPQYWIYRVGNTKKPVYHMTGKTISASWKLEAVWDN